MIKHLDAHAFHLGEGRTALRLRVLRMGKDVCLLLDGGDTPHTGAVAVAHASHDKAHGASLADITLPGHREGELARTLAQRIQAQLGVTVTLLCGIHIDGITRHEIETVLTGAETLVNQWLATLLHH